MTTDKSALRYGGIQRLYGTQAFDLFSKSHVCVIGIGGVGSWAVEALARSGIGKLTLIDMDDLCVSNTNRQIHALSKTIGKQKIEVMAERCKQINPNIEVTCIDDFVNKENCFKYLSNEFDYIFDAIDSISAKISLIAHCKRNKYPFLTCGGAGGQMDPTQIKVTDLSRTIQDPLAAKLKSELRAHYNFPKNPKRKFRVHCVFSSEQLYYPQSDGETSHQKYQSSISNTSSTSKMDCSSGLGASTVVTGSFAFVAVAFILKKLQKNSQAQSTLEKR